MLELARTLERHELIAEWRRLHADGHANPHTYARIAVACIALCGRRPETYRHYHALGCDLLGLGAELYSAMLEAEALGTDELIKEAIADLTAASAAIDRVAQRKAQDALRARADEAALKEAEAIAGAPLLPPGFRMGDVDLVKLARMTMAMPGDMNVAVLRQAFAGAIEAHREGRLGEWMDTYPDAGAVWPGRP